MCAPIKTVQFPRERMAWPGGRGGEAAEWKRKNPEIRNKSLSFWCFSDFGLRRVVVCRCKLLAFDFLTLSPHVRPIKQIRWEKGKLVRCAWVCWEMKMRFLSRWQTNGRTTDTPKLECDEGRCVCALISGNVVMATAQADCRRLHETPFPHCHQCRTTRCGSNFPFEDFPRAFQSVLFHRLLGSTS